MATEHNEHSIVDDDCMRCGAEVVMVYFDKDDTRYTWRACSECKTVHPIIKRDGSDVISFVRLYAQTIPEGGLPTNDMTSLEDLLNGEYEPDEEVRENGDEESHAVVEAVTDKRPKQTKGEKKTRGDVIQELLLAGFSRAAIAEMTYEPTGEKFNEGSIRLIASKLRSQGAWSPEMERDEVSVNGAGEDIINETALAMAGGGQEKQMRIYAKGAPPEAIISSLPLPGPGSVEFQHGMQFGMQTLVLAVRIMHELANIGAQQASPLIKLAKEMRAGEEVASRNAAQEAVALAGREFLGILGPSLEKIDALERNQDAVALAAATAGSGDNPMLGMMVRTMEPIFKNVMNNAMKRFTGGAGMDAESNTPSGWTRERR